MTVRIRTHGAVFGSLFKHLLEIGHIRVNVVLQSNNGTLFGILEQVSIAELRIEHKFRKGFCIRHFQ